MSSPVEFGHSMLKQFSLDPEFTNLNHGSFGSLPRTVLAACNDLAAEVEANPDLFMRLTYLPLLNTVRERVAKLIGAEADECVMVPNVATGINTVLRNFVWEQGDVIILTNTAFDSISRAARSISDTPPHPTVVEFQLSFPSSNATILAKFREYLHTVKRSRDAGSNPKGKIVAVLDSIASGPGILMPWQEMVQICKEEGVWSVIDAAHSIGQEVGLNLTKAGPDFWVSSCAKWLYSKRGSAVLYVPKRNQHIIKSSLPTGLGYLPQSKEEVYSPFISQFFWSGTTDPTSILSVSAALDYRASLGGEEKINAYCHGLAQAGGKRLAEVMGTSVMETDPNDGQTAISMVNVELPLPAHIKSSAEVARLFHHKMLVEQKAYAAHFYHNGKWWTRASAQIYNEIEDFEKLGRAFVAVCQQIAEAPGV